MQKNRSKWLVGLLVLATMIIGVAALAVPPKAVRLTLPELNGATLRANIQNYEQRHQNLPAFAGHLPKLTKPITVQSHSEAVTADPNANGWAEGGAVAIATNGTYVAWADINGLLAIATASNPSQPIIYGPGTTGGPTSLQFVGNVLYGNYGSGVWAIDLTDPANPGMSLYRMNCYAPEGVADFRVHQGYIYAALYDYGFIVYKVGNPSFPVLYAYSADPQVIAANNTSIMGLAGWSIYQVEATDASLILVGTNGGAVNGECFLFNIVDKTNPIVTFVNYPGSPFDPTWTGNEYLDSSQIQWVAGSLFAGNSKVNAGLPGTNMGVTRVEFPDPTNATSFASGSGWFSVNDGATGPAKLVAAFNIQGSGSQMFDAYPDQGDQSILGSLPDDSVGAQWNWSAFASPTVTLNYTTRPFFFNNSTALTTYNGGTALAFYGGFGIAAPPTPGAFSAYVAGFNYVGAFDATGSLAAHYTLGYNPTFYGTVPGSLSPELPAGATAENLLSAADGSFVIYWYPEGFTIADAMGGMRIGAWEVPNNTDYVRNVAITSDDHYALVSCGSLGLITVDISTPASPVTVGNWWTNPTAPSASRQPVTYVFVNGRYAYVQTRVVAVDPLNPNTNVNVVRILDISDPPLPAEVAAYAAPTGTQYWDVNAMTVASAYAYNGQTYMVISNGQGLKDPNFGLASDYNPLKGNSILNLANGTPASLIVANIATPSAMTGMYNVPLNPGAGNAYAYANMAAFVAPQGGANYWAFVTTWNGISTVNMGDPASPLTAQVAYATGGPLDKIYPVQGADQIMWGFFGGHLNLIGDTQPLAILTNWLQSIGGVDYFAQMPNNTWITNDGNGAISVWDNLPDYQPPYFTGGYAGSGWISPICTGLSCPLTAPVTFKVQAQDNVGVVGVVFLALYSSGTHWDSCRPGYTVLGFGTGPDANNDWSLTLNDLSMFQWQGPVVIAAEAFDAGGNATMLVDPTFETWTVSATPAVSVSVANTGSASYVWSTVTMSATVTPIADDPQITRVLFKVDGLSIGNGTYNPTTGTWNIAWNTTAVADGTHQVTAEATSANGNVGVSPALPVFVANNGPNNVILTAPLAGSQVYGTAVPVSATVGTWPVPIDHVSFYLDRPANATSGGTLIGTATTGTPGSVKEASTIYSITWDTTTVADGNHTIVAVATDKRWDGSMRNGNSTWVSFSKVTPAPLTVSITTSPASPTDATPVTAVAATTGGIAPYTYAWTVDGAAVTGTGDSITETLAAGTHTFGVTVTDSTATTQTATASVTVAPSVVPPVIAAVSKAGNPFRLKVSGSNFQSGAVVKINGTAVTTKFKSASLVVAKQCKSLCPKGTAVQVTVTNPDGGVSNAVSFTR